MILPSHTTTEGQGCWGGNQLGLCLVPVFSTLLPKFAIASKGIVVMGPGPGSVFCHSLCFLSGECPQLLTGGCHQVLHEDLTVVQA